MTFGDFSNSTAGDIAGVCPSSQAFVNKTNEAVRRLLRRGDWAGTAVPIYICVFNGCIVMPRYIGEIREVNVCNRHVPTKGLWWDFLDVDRNTLWNSQAWWGWRGTQVGWKFSGRTPVTQDIQGDGRTVRIYKSTSLDNNKSVTIFGTDTNGQTLMSKGAGAWSEGYRLVFSPKSDHAETPMTVRNITRILKDPTEGFVHLYAFNQGTGLLEDLCHYEPSETNPNYAKYKVFMPTGCCAGDIGVLVLAKLAFVPVVGNPNDLILIDNVDALKAEIQAVRFAEAGDIQSKMAFEADAVRELNRQLEDENPDQHVPIVNAPLAGTGIGRMHCF